MSGLFASRRPETVLRGRVLRLRGDAVSVRWDPRTVTVCALLAAATIVVAILSLTTGDYPVSLAGVVRSLLGHGTGAESFIVVTLRLPRLIAAALIGAALGMSGAVFQSLSRNPLGSPDIIGFTSGASAGAVAEIVVFHGGQYAVMSAALLGGLATALVVYLLSVSHGRMSGFRLVLVGIGVSAMLVAVVAYLLTRASLYEARDAEVWLIGSLNGIGWNVVGPLALAMLILVPVTMAAGRQLSWLEMGDDAAHALGVPVERTRLLLVVASTALAAVATASAGPITFVALAAPQLCRGLTRAAGPHVGPSALTGALLLSASDLIAQRVLPVTELPVGVLTGSLGGVYLCWLIARGWKSG